MDAYSQNWHKRIKLGSGLALEFHRVDLVWPDDFNRALDTTHAKQQHRDRGEFEVAMAGSDAERTRTLMGSARNGLGAHLLLSQGQARFGLPVIHG